MNCRTRLICLIFAAGLTIGTAEPTPAQARDATAASVDCSKADSMMMAPPAMPAMTPSGDVDKDFAKAMIMHNTAMMKMMKMEMACGKDAKTKAFAKKRFEEETLNDGFLRQLIGGGG
jgi:uncharacterized protein (DUF305 family)